MKVWQALYCFCIHESSDRVLSIHKTRQGAKRAMVLHKLKKRGEWKEYRKEQEKSMLKHMKEDKEIWSAELKDMYLSRFGAHESWGINEVKILD